MLEFLLALGAAVLSKRWLAAASAALGIPSALVGGLAALI